MSLANREEQIGAHPASDPPPVNTENPLSFVTPTEFVELPSKGKFYHEEHPLHNEETVEIKYMTAKDEDILTSQTLIKKGIVIDRLLKNLLIDKRIKPEDLLIGDKNAMVVAARATGYGELYETRVTCPACLNAENHEFLLSDLKSIPYEENIEKYNITVTDKNTFIVTLPKSNTSVELKLLTGHEEIKLAKLTERKRKNKLAESFLTDQFRSYIVSVNGDTNSVGQFIDIMPASDSRYLRSLYEEICPNVDLKQTFTCSVCDFEGPVGVPFTADFFWPK